MSRSRRSEQLRFTLVIPALDEEEAIASTLERALAARQDVIANTPLTEMSVVLVDDGSTDATLAIAERYPDVITLAFPKNRGYGAAIKSGFEATNAELLGFMDADGTCDPCFCADLVNQLLRTGSDIVVGSRMNSQSEMPIIRRLGNLIFARLVGAVSGQALTDSASGMRVLRREVLMKLQPLPDGLHFTPAMTSLALLDPRIKISEVPMPYLERSGDSKLRVVKDGFRFLLIILFTAALFNPIKSLAVLGALFFALGAGLCVVGYKLGFAASMLLVLASAFGIVGLQAIFVGFLCHQMLHMLLGPWRVSNAAEGLMQKHGWTTQMVRLGVIILLVGLVAALVGFGSAPPWHAIWESVAAVCVLAAGWTALAGVILRVVWAAKQRRIAELEHVEAH